MIIVILIFNSTIGHEQEVIKTDKANSHMKQMNHFAYPEIKRDLVDCAEPGDITTAIPEGTLDLPAFGIMFDVQSKVDDMLITQLSFYSTSEANTELSYLLFTVDGSYEDHLTNSLGWELIANGTTITPGEGSLTPIPDELSVMMEKFKKRGFYISLLTRELQYLKSDKSSGQMFISNDDIEIFVGAGTWEYSPDTGPIIFADR